MAVFESGPAACSQNEALQIPLRSSCPIVSLLAHAIDGCVRKRLLHLVARRCERADHLVYLRPIGGIFRRPQADGAKDLLDLAAGKRGAVTEFFAQRFRAATALGEARIPA